MRYSQFDLADFLNDEYFIQSTLQPTKESRHFWDQWLSHNPEKRAVYELAIEVANSIDYAHRYRLSDEDYSEMLETILQENSTDIPFHKRINLSRVFYRVAAVLVIGVCLAMLYYQTESVPPRSKKESIERSITLAGQKKTIYLPDGSKVILNAESEIIYPTQFDNQARNVQLKGEAFFEVVRNPEKPFIIETGELSTQVLGTSFNIKYYHEEPNISVSVVSGKVSVKANSGESQLLTTDEEAIFDKKLERLDKAPFDVNKKLGWVSGNLLFENEDLRSIFRKLEKWYGVKITVSPNVSLEGQYSGEYKQKSLETVLQGISYTSNFKFTIDQRTVNINN